MDETSGRTRARSPTERVTVRLPQSLMQSVDTLVSMEKFRSRTDVLYAALKAFIQIEGAKANETLAAEKGVLELKKLAADFERLRNEFGQK